MATRTLQIDGMSCGHCVKAVTMALQDLPGVDVTHVAVGVATIDADDAVVSPAQLAQAIADAGFTLVTTTAAS
jgi:copper chaperone